MNGSGSAATWKKSFADDSVYFLLNNKIKSIKTRNQSKTLSVEA